MNVRRLAALKVLFSWRDSEIAKATGYSRPYLVRLLACDLAGSDAFWRRLEDALGALVASRSSQVFDHSGTPLPVDVPAPAGAGTSMARK